MDSLDLGNDEYIRIPSILHDLGQKADEGFLLIASE